MSVVTFRNLQAYVVGKVGQPAIFLVHEWWGLNEQMKGLADRFAARGFQVATPDLYHGKVASDANEANHLMSGLDFKAAVDELAVWAKYLKEERKAPAVGVAGTCMGGALTVAAASKHSATGLVNAATVFYGIPDLSVFPVESIQCPMLLHFGDLDDIAGFSDRNAVKKLTDKLKAAGKQFELKTYPQAKHAFINEKRPEVYRPEDAKAAFESTVSFFQKNLKQ